MEGDVEENRRKGDKMVDLKTRDQTKRQEIELRVESSYKYKYLQF